MSSRPDNLVHKPESEFVMLLSCDREITGLRLGLILGSHDLSSAPGHSLTSHRVFSAHSFHRLLTKAKKREGRKWCDRNKFCGPVASNLANTFRQSLMECFMAPIAGGWMVVWLKINLTDCNKRNQTLLRLGKIASIINWGENESFGWPRRIEEKRDRIFFNLLHREKLLNEKKLHSFRLESSTQP